MIEAWPFVQGTLASFFVAWLFTSSKITEPFMEPIRWRFERQWQRKHGEGSSTEWNSKRAYLLSCVKCLGFWVSGVTTMLLSLAYGVDFSVITWLAMAGGVVVLGSIATA